MNQQPFFSKDAPLSEQDASIVAQIEALPADKQQDAIALLFGAIVTDYKTASEEQRLTMSPFCKFFAELDQSPETQKPQQVIKPDAAIGNADDKIVTSNDALAGGSIVNQ
jgi:hypothetical protein